MELILDIFVYTVGFLILLVGAIFVWAILFAFYKVYIKKDSKIAVRRSPELTEEEKEALLEQFRENEKNWIQLHVEKLGDQIYFYDGDEETGVFLFQCKTYDEMIENLNRIRGHRGVRIDAELVSKLEMQDFFVTPETKLMQVKSETNKNESI